MSDNSSNRTDVSTIHFDNISLQNREYVDSNSKFIGFDLSTQQLKVIVIDDRLKVCHQIKVNFDEELSEYKTRGGVYKSDDGSNSVTAPVNMWLKALDICFDKLKIDGLDFSTVIGISGCAQQHGSVWWRRESSILLNNLNPDEYLHKALVSSFSLRESPIWMDSSTSEECKLLELFLGGGKKLASITGSRAYERFTGPQIAKVLRFRPELYAITERITLISNFLASILCGSYAPFDVSDASGMNMMDLKSKKWSIECLESIVKIRNKFIDNNLIIEEQEDIYNNKEILNLRLKLGCSDSTMIDDNIVDTNEIIGRISRYFVERYGFPPECLISSFTGDNPASMAGLSIGQEEVIISLGTSDTIFFWLDEPTPNLNGHVLRNPLDESKYMGLICFKNGSKTRERIRDLYANGNWDEFSKLLDTIPRGNFGNIGFYFDFREIYPLCVGDFKFNKLNQHVDSFPSNEFEIRACLESQFMRLYLHSKKLGLNMSKLTRVLVTGGASINKAILQVISDIFQLPVYTLDLQDSACLGSAYLAKYAYELEQQKLDQSFDISAKTKLSSIDNSLKKLNDDDNLDNKREDNESGAGDCGEEFLEKSINFNEMVRNEGERNLIKICEPTPIGASTGNVYENLLNRYEYLEEQLSLNNDG